MNPRLSELPPQQLDAYLAKRQWQKVENPSPIAPTKASIQLPGCQHTANIQLYHRQNLRLAAIRTAPDQHNLDTTTTLAHRLLDLTPLQRSLLWGTQSRCTADLTLILAETGSGLWHTKSEIRLADIPPNTPQEELSNLLWALEPSEITEPPQPDILQTGEEFQQWFDLMAGTLGPPLQWSREETARLLRQAILGYKSITLNVTGGHWKPLESIGIYESRQNATWQYRMERMPPAELLERLLEKAETLCPSRAGAFTALERKALKRQIETIPAGRLSKLWELLQMGKQRLAASAQQTIVFPADASHTASRLALVEPLQVNREIQQFDLYVVEPLTLDISLCGIGRVLEAIEKLAHHGWKLHQDLQNAGGRQLDLVENSREHPGETLTQFDPFQWTCQKALRLKAAPQYHEKLAFLIASHILDLRAACFPNLQVDAPLHAVPSVFPKHKKSRP